ncbi:transmembrane protein 182 isoform X2 [Heterocephalus glaber]|uniref:Transmembrane protein 182 n=1 Tax=Heterocephalus glaber TaxID=10181 RepID=A0AAX6SZR9_HETGA|nr:transmembrane protein 182 isoform X2 [Heterocephalus glaber]
MRLNIAIFFGALFGALGVLLFLVAFGSDYWLLATEVERCSGEQQIADITFYHEGFFWRCWFSGVREENYSSTYKFWYTNQPPFKNCTHAYLSPYPFTRGQHNSTAYDSAVSALYQICGCISSRIFYHQSSFLTLSRHHFHAGHGGTGGSRLRQKDHCILFVMVVLLYTIWVQLVADFEGYRSMKLKDCLEFTPSVLFGWSFFVAPAGIFFSLLAGLLFLVVGRHIQLHH